MNTEQFIFRFKFSSEFNDNLLSFAKLHQLEDRHTYKDNWNRWILSNSSIIDDESTRLKQLGYTGDIIDKMYKSGRYYYRTKKSNQTQTERRKYISIDTDIIDLMDKYINDTYEQNIILKPSTTFNLFLKEYESNIISETNRLNNLELNDNEIKLKIKKTYKNRYFLYNKQISSIIREH